jgi:hypothetical protein
LRRRCSASCNFHVIPDLTVTLPAPVIIPTPRLRAKDGLIPSVTVKLAAARLSPSMLGSGGGKPLALIGSARARDCGSRKIHEPGESTTSRLHLNNVN